MNIDKKLFLTNLQSGVTVSLISIPLSVSLAVASNASPTVGILTAVWAGLMAALFGGSHYNIVGPTGALSGIIAVFVITQGAALLPSLAVITGLIILISYFLRLERYLIFVPSSVIHGFTLGVAFIIGLNQLNGALGLTGLKQHPEFIANIEESLRHLGNSSFSAFGIFLLFLGGLLLFKKFVPKLPGAIFLAPVGIFLGYLSEKGIISLSLITLGEKFTDISFKIFEPSIFTWNVALIQTALVVALVAILETMLSAKIADGMTQTKHNERHEMFGLSMANIVTGLFGGMPATAALARTALNVKTGATDRLSGIINSVSVAVIAAFFLSSFQFIPLPVVSAILVFVAIGMIEKGHFERLWRADRPSFWVALLVAVVTIVVDPMYGILLGVAVALLLFVRKITEGSCDIKLNSMEKGLVAEARSEQEIKNIKEDAEVVLYSFHGKLCYLNSKTHLSRFEKGFLNYKTIILRLKEVDFIDMDGVEVFDEIVRLIEKRDQRVLVTGVTERVRVVLDQLSHTYKDLEEKNLTFTKTTEALASLGIRK